MSYIYSESGFYGGLSDNRMLGAAKTFQSATGVEIRKNPASLKLAHPAEKISASIVTDLVQAFLTVESTGDVLMFGSTGKIYRRAAGAGTPVLCYTDTGNASIYSAFEYNGCIYWATSTHLHRIAVGNVDDAWAGDVTEDYKTFANGNTNHPMVEMSNNLYIGDGSNLAELDSVGTWTNNILTIFGDEEIIALNFTGAMMRIYSRRSSKVDYSRCYLWDGIASAYNELILWEGIRIQAVTNKDGMDYIVAGKRPSIYSSNGYQRELLKRLPGITGSLEIYPNAIGIFDDLIAIGAAKSGDAIKRGAWTWGAENKNYPPSLNFDYPTSNNNTTDVIGAVHQSDGVLYFSWYDGSVWGVDAVNTAKYISSGYLITRVYRGDAGFVEKEVGSLRMSFAQLAAGEKIEIYARKNLESAWGSVIADAKYSETADRGITSKQILAVFDDQNFDFIELKIVLTAGTSQLTTPEIIELGVPFEIIKEE